MNRTPSPAAGSPCCARRPAWAAPYKPAFAALAVRDKSTVVN
ncbi:hypothetical protein ACSLFT_23540 [Streptomyces sp. G6]